LATSFDAAPLGQVQFVSPTIGYLCVGELGDAGIEPAIRIPRDGGQTWTAFSPPP